MYPNPPDFRSGLPGSAWFVVTKTDGPHVVITQWDVIVRAFQAKARDHLLPIAYYRSSSGQCPAPTVGGTVTSATQWSDLFSTYVGSTNVRRRDQLTVDGVFGPETADALWALLCMTHQTQRAEEWAAAITQRVIPLEFVRQMIWFAFYVDSVNGDYNGTPVFTNSVDGSAISIPSTAIAPTWDGVVVSAPADQLWISEFRPGIDPLPVAPSAAAAAGGYGAGRIPTRISWPVTLGVVALAGGITWWLTAAPKQPPHLPGPGHVYG
jgi:hypothetical protein